MEEEGRVSDVAPAEDGGGSAKRSDGEERRSRNAWASPHQPRVPWASPHQEPNNGVVQPRVVPPIGKPTRHTNQLDYILNTVMKEAMKHKHSWPFNAPVDAVKLGIPEYHKVIKRPMDLKTIEKRLKNVYYYSAKDCLEDIMVMFNNCYTFNPPHYGVYVMGKELEHVMLDKISHMPENEEEMSRPSSNRRGPKSKQKERVRMSLTASKNRRGGDPDLNDLPAHVSKEQQRVLDHFHYASQAASGSRESSVRAPSVNDPETPMEVSESVTPAAAPPVLDASTSSSNGDQRTPKSLKRKGEEEDMGKVSARRESTRPIKKPNLFIDYSSLQPRFKGKLTESMKFCQKMINELLSKKYKSFAWPFYDPVDVEGLGLSDYYEIIAHPMDLGTVKKKLDNKQYANAQEFADDVRLICTNCMTYNPKTNQIHQFGEQLLKMFNEKWLHLPKDEVVSESPVGSYSGSLLMIKPETEDQRIEKLLTKAIAEKRAAQEKLDQLNSVCEQLKEFLASRHEALKAGMEEPKIPQSLIANAEKVMDVHSIVDNLVSPAPSNRSSIRSSTIREEYKPEPSVTPPPTKRVKTQAAHTPASAQSTTDRPYSGRGRRPGSKNKPKMVLKKKSDHNHEDSDDELAMSYEDKRALSAKINLLPPNKLQSVLEIIESHQSLNNEASREEVEIDFEALLPATLRDLSQYVNQSIARRPRKNNPRPADDKEEEKVKTPVKKAAPVLEAASYVESGPSTSALPPPEPAAEPEAASPIPADPSKDTKSSSSESSSESSDGEDSTTSSSDSSDSEAGPRLDELTSRGRPPVRPIAQAAAKGRNGVPPPRMGAPHPTYKSNLAPAKPAAAKAPPAQLNLSADSTLSSPTHSEVIAKSHVHAGAKPLLENDKPVVSGGVGVSILDQLLPSSSTDKKDSSQPVVSKSSANKDFDAFKMKHKQKEEKRRQLQAEEEARRRQKSDRPYNYEMPPLDPDEEARINRLREEERRKRDAEDNVGMTNQMELMANFEANF